MVSEGLCRNIVTSPRNCGLSSFTVSAFSKGIQWQVPAAGVKVFMGVDVGEPGVCVGGDTVLGFLPFLLCQAGTVCY